LCDCPEKPTLTRMVQHRCSRAVTAAAALGGTAGILKILQEQPLCESGLTEEAPAFAVSAIARTLPYGPPLCRSRPESRVDLPTTHGGFAHATGSSLLTRAAWLTATLGASAAVARRTSRHRQRGLVSWLAGRGRSTFRGGVARASEVLEEGEAQAAATDDTKVKTPLPVWVVNLDKSKDRWSKCVEEFQKQDVQADRFPATLGKAVPQEELEEKTTFGARYFCTPGMIGCFMSHMRIWERVVNEDLEAVVALEDDVVLYPNFNERLRDVLQELPDDWDVCLIGAVGCIAEVREPFYMKFYGLITGGGRPAPGTTRSVSENIFVPYRPAGTHAYVVSRKGAEKLLKECPQARYHVDITAWALPDLRLYAVKGFLATQRFEGDTTVSKEGAPLTKRFLHWLWEISGFAHMGRKGGLPNLVWAWKIAVFALPIPWSKSKRRLIVEMGPSSSIGVLFFLLCIPLHSLKPAGWGIAYMTSILATIRWLAGTQSRAALAILCLISGVLVTLG